MYLDKDRSDATGRKWLFSFPIPALIQFNGLNRLRKTSGVAQDYPGMKPLNQSLKAAESSPGAQNFRAL